METGKTRAAPLWLGILGAVSGVGSFLVALVAFLWTVIPPTSAQLPDVFKDELGFGVARLAGAGFTNVSVETICSGSVDQGLIREVILSTGADVDEETTLVGANGPSQIDVPFGAKIIVKESTGIDC